ncbi:MAG: hypothetical protein ACOY41_08865 [Pseudomonadota bacterium]
MLKKIVMACAGGLLSLAAFAASPYDKPGFVTFVQDGRLWVFQEGAKELEEFQKHGEPTIHVSKIGEGPEGMTLKGASYETLDAYLSSK